MRTLDPKILTLIATAALLAGACGPVAGSVSKLGGGGGDSPFKNINAQDAPDVEESSQVTDVVTEDQFNDKWPAITTAHPTMVIEEPQFTDVKAKLELGEAAHIASKGAKIEGNEGTLAGPKAKIRHRIIVKNGTDIQGLGLEEVVLKITWVPKGADVKDAHWELSVASPARPGADNTDPASDTHAQNVRDALFKKMSGIAIEFEAEL